MKACRAWIGGRGWTRDPEKLRKEEVGLQGKWLILFLKGPQQPMLPTEGTGKRKPKEEDGGGRQKKEQDRDQLLHKSLGRRQKREMQEERGFPN